MLLRPFVNWPSKWGKERGVYRRQHFRIGSAIQCSQQTRRPWVFTVVYCRDPTHRDDLCTRELGLYHNYPLWAQTLTGNICDKHEKWPIALVAVSKAILREWGKERGVYLRQHFRIGSAIQCSQQTRRQWVFTVLYCRDPTHREHPFLLELAWHLRPGTPLLR